MATKRKTTAANAATTSPVLSLAEIAGFDAAETAKAFGERARTATRVFIEQGKLVYHLKSCLKKKQSIYGVLQAEHGVSQGSIDIAVKVANLIAELIEPGHVTEARFDEVITFRIAKSANFLITGSGKAAVKLTAEQIADLLRTGETAPIGDELECLYEHGVTIAEREAAESSRIQAEADKAAADRAAADAKQAAAEKAKADAETAKVNAEAEAAALRAQLAAATPPTIPTPPANVIPEAVPLESESALEPEEEQETVVDQSPLTIVTPDEAAEDSPDSAQPTVAVASTKVTSPPPAIKPTAVKTAPTKPTIGDVITRLKSAMNDALDLSPDEIAIVVTFLHEEANDLAATLEPLQVAAA